MAGLGLTCQIQLASTKSHSGTTPILTISITFAMSRLYTNAPQN